MTWSVTISGHIGSRETEDAVVKSLRNFIAQLNQDGTRYVSEAVVATSYGDRIDLLEAPKDEFMYARPVVATDRKTEDLEVEEVDGTDKIIVGSEVMQDPSSDENKKSNVNDEPTSVDQPAKSSVKSLDEIKGDDSGSKTSRTSTKR